jgi:hypothetical protein
LKDGKFENLTDKVSFNVKGLNNQTLVAKNTEETDKFRNELMELNRQVTGSSNLLGESKEKRCN